MIPPALSAAEWAQGQYGDDILSVERWVDDDRKVSIYLMDQGPDMADEGEPPMLTDASVVVADDEKAALMAIMNDALPDDSPHKITRADVALLRGIYEDWIVMDPREVKRLADKLEALLRPND